MEAGKKVSNHYNDTSNGLIILNSLTMGVATIDIKNNKEPQAIRIPKQMWINDDKVYLEKVGNTL